MARPRKFDEQVVLTAARDAFWQRGYASTSVQELREATGVGVQSLYGAFGSKHDLFLRVLDDYCACQAAGLEAAVEADPSPWHALRSAVVFEDGGRLELPKQGCLMANSTAALSAHDEDVRSRSRRLYAGTTAFFARKLAEAAECGEVDPNIDQHQSARALMAVMQGFEFLCKSGIDEDEIGQLKEAVHALIEQFVAPRPRDLDTAEGTGS